MQQNQPLITTWYCIKRFKKTEKNGEHYPDEIVAVCSKREWAEKVKREGPQYSIDSPSSFRIVIEEHRVTTTDMEAIRASGQWDRDIWNVLSECSSG